jgi:hypothetical protein
VRRQRGAELVGREAAEQLEDALALVQRERGHVDQRGHVVGVVRGGGDHRAAVGVADQYDRAVDLPGQRRHLAAVGGRAAQVVRYGDRGDAAVLQLGDHAGPAAAVGEGSVHQQGGGVLLAHCRVLDLVSRFRLCP